MFDKWSDSVATLVCFFLMNRRPPRSTRMDTPFPDTMLVRSVKEDDLIVPLGDRLALRDEARGIVAAAFGGAGAARRGAGIILRHPERHRGRARQIGRAHV